MKMPCNAIRVVIESLSVQALHDLRRPEMALTDGIGRDSGIDGFLDQVVGECIVRALLDAGIADQAPIEQLPKRGPHAFLAPSRHLAEDLNVERAADDRSRLG